MLQDRGAPRQGARRSKRHARAKARQNRNRFGTEVHQNRRAPEQGHAKTGACRGQIRTEAGGRAGVEICRARGTSRQKRIEAGDAGAGRHAEVGARRSKDPFRTGVRRDRGASGQGYGQSRSAPGTERPPGCRRPPRTGQSFPSTPPLYIPVQKGQQIGGPRQSWGLKKALEGQNAGRPLKRHRKSLHLYRLPLPPAPQPVKGQLHTKKVF